MASAGSYINRVCRKFGYEIKKFPDSSFTDSIQSEFGLHHHVHKLAMQETLQYIKQHMNDAICIKDNRKKVFFDYVLPKIMKHGSVLEFGVHKGMTLSIIAENIKKRVCHGFDSFEGLPEDWSGRLFYRKGSFNVDGKLPKVPKNVILHKGWFDESLPIFLKENEEKIAFLHIDCDLYSSTKTVFNLLEDRIIPGTIILFDEYFNYPNWKQHEFKAFKEFVKKNNIQYKYLAYSDNQQVCVEII